MKIKDLTQMGTFGWTGYLTEDNLQDSLQMLTHCHEILKSCLKWIAIVYCEDDEVYRKFHDYVTGKSIEVHRMYENRGHTFGTIDLEEKLWEYADDNEFLFKCSQDTIINESLMETNVPNADFYFVPGFSYETLTLFNNDDRFAKTLVSDYKSSYVTPNTNFYIVRRKDSFLYGRHMLIDNLYRRYKEALENDSNFKPWDLRNPVKVDCENLLKDNLQKNNYTFHNILPLEESKKLITFIRQFKIGDPSHKNIYLPSGILHYQWLNQPVYEI